MRVLFLLFGGALLVSCGSKTPRFERLDSSDTGVSFINEIVDKDTFNIMHNEYMYNGGGTGVADLNNDGLNDLVFVGNKVSSRIYLNLGNLKFKDITSKFEGLDNHQWLSGVAVTDINADGWADLYFTSTMSDDSLLRKNQLWVNQGLQADGLPAFKEMAGQYGIADMGHSMQAAFFDYDLDGDPDLYILNNLITERTPTSYHVKIADGTAQNNDRLYENLGNGKFADVTLKAGIVYEGFGLGLAIGDINKDGYPDIYVSNDYISSDLLYINQGDGTFKEEAARYLSYLSKSSMGNDMADVNNDGNPDIFTMDMMPSAYFRKKQTINGHGYLIYNLDKKLGYQHQYVRNMLHLHNGFLNGEMLPFSEVGQMEGIYQTEWSWSPLFADFDNDGDRDLFITNGFPKDLTDKDFTKYKAQMYGYLASDYDLMPRIPVAKTSNFAFENLGDYKFANHTDEWGMRFPSFSNGAAFVDLDNDGDLDYVTNNINDEAFIYRNNTIGKLESPSNYLRIALKGSGANTLATGAKITLWCNGQLQYCEHNLTRGYISSIDPIVHFGLGSSNKIDSLRVIWPGGNSTTFLKNVQPNQFLALKEEGAIDYTPQPPAPSLESHLFSRAGHVVDYTHDQEDFVDYFLRQPIIQHKFSQIGPCMTKGDIDGDGQKDLITGGAPESPVVVFLNKGGHFESAKFSGLTETRKCTESDILAVDIDGDGDDDIIAVAGGYANDKKEDYQHSLYVNDGGVFTKVVLPVPPFPASVVRPHDFDHDGDADLFIGARVERENFPYAPPSFILINDSGRFSAGRTMSFDLGMVTDAVWSDYDGDGWEDILLTREWNSIAILKNAGGKEFKLTGQNDLDGMHGLWYSIAAGDFDHDGDDDYIVGNFGENHRFTVSDSYPMRLYAIDIDNSGIIAPITAAFWPDEKGVMREYPVNYLDELAAQSPFFHNKFSSYTHFSYATMDSILDRAALPGKSKFFVNSTSSYFLWNEGKGFKWERLPSVVQTSPVKEILVSDFNSDGRPDVFLAGNDYSCDVSTGYIDANKGIFLMGKGGQAFEVLPPAKSGLVVNGQVESLAYFEGDTPLLFIGINRDTLRVFQQIKK